MIYVPVDSVDDDGCVGGELLGEVGDVPLGVRLELGRVEPAAILPLELVVPAHLQEGFAFMSCFKFNVMKMYRGAQNGVQNIVKKDPGRARQSR